MKKTILILIILLNLSLVIAYDVCSDTNQYDLSDIPCMGVTTSLNCSGNITIYDSTNLSLNYSIITNSYLGLTYNFTLNLSSGEWILFDCENKTAIVTIGYINEGYGINLLIIMFPSLLLSFILLFFSGSIFKKLKDNDKESYEEYNDSSELNSFIPKNRLIPIILMLFSFIPLIFMIGFIKNYLAFYLPLANITKFYSMFYILFTYIFYIVFLISFVVWLSDFIKTKKIMNEIGD